jgi:ribosome-associated toxin RatA of RatAB toxin-antitoxin module
MATPLVHTQAGLGGRARARRGLVAGLMLAATAGLAGAGSAAAQPVTVREEGGVYRVAATFEAAQPSSLVRQVLTDYDQIPRFMPGVRSSRVIAREPAHVVVEQEAHAKVLFFSKTIHLRLVVRETPDTIAFTDACGRSFHRYEGTWTLREQDGKAVVTYQLIAQPAFDVPEFLLTRLLKRDATRMIAGLQAEISARAATPSADRLPASLVHR